VHLGHLASAEHVAAAFDLATVLLMLSARPPHKPTHRPAPIENRWEMLRLATRDRPLLRPSDLEVRRPGPSYTVDTLLEVTRIHPRHDIFLIVGIDAYAEVDTWHRPDQLLALANIVVTTRPGHPLPSRGIEPPIAGREDCCYDPAIGGHTHKSGHRLFVHLLDGLNISSSEIRRRAGAGLDVSDLTGDEIAEYIRSHGLYEVPGR
jgi:nicotinate-nucleotide adenylyltransferase